MSEELESQEVKETEPVDSVAERKNITMGSILGLLSLTMFIGGALVTLMLLARSFEVHGMALVAFVLTSCALVLGLAGYLVTNLMGHKPALGAFIGALLGAVSGLMLYLTTKEMTWWQ